jgi:hypothetical protein
LSDKPQPDDTRWRLTGSLGRFLMVSVPKLAAGIGTIALNLVLIRYLAAEDLALVSLCLAGVLLVDSIAGSALDMGTLKLATASRDTDPQASVEVQKHAIYL